jgi:MFS family permease
MRRRFSLYGFFKNQRYFEPFLWLAFLDRGLTFFDIGLLIAVREAVIVALELPSGALADAFGRRRAMILSFLAYVAAFPILALATGPAALAAGMAAYGVGDAFRTGTHKAMIFAWLASQGRQDERTEFYGYTRSWSKIGSAVSIVVGATLVLVLERYEPLFLFATLPYVAGIVNFLGYPAELDGTGRARKASMLALLRSGARRCWRQRWLRRLLAESMGFEGLFHAIKDYLQPVLAVMAATLLVRLGPAADWTDMRRTALLVGPVYLLLYVAAAVASRKAHRVVDRAGGAERGARSLWIALCALSALLVASDLLDLVGVTVLAFVIVHLLQNLWRPVLIGRIDQHAPAEEGATVLSMESLSRRMSTMVWAPVLGAAVDWAAGSSAVPGTGVWALGVAGVASALVALTTFRGSTDEAIREKA